MCHLGNNGKATESKMYLGNVKIDEELGSGTFGSLFVGHLLEEERKNCS